MNEEKHIRQLSEIGYSSCEIEKLRKAMPVFREMLAEDTAEQIESPPVEIPVRVVLITNHMMGIVATVDRVRGDGGVYCYPDNDPRRHLVWPGDFIELQLTPAEQCRLLLEQMSRESIKRYDLGDPLWYIALDGQVFCFPTKYATPHGEMFFARSDDAARARDAVIRAGLTPEEWEVG